MNKEQIVKVNVLQEIATEEEHEEGDTETCPLYDENSKKLVDSNSRPSIYKGIIYALSYGILFSLSSVIVKYLVNLEPCQLTLSRSIGTFLLTIPLIIFYDQNPLGPKNVRHYLVLRGIFGCTTLVLRYYAIRYLPLGDASVIIFSGPVFVSVFASFFLKEPCGVVQSISVFLTLIGLCLTAKLPILFIHEHTQNGETIAFSKTITESTGEAAINNEQMYGTIAALSSTLFTASAYIIIRKAKEAHFSVILLNYGWVSVIESSVITAVLDGFSIPDTASEWSLIVAMAILSFLGQLLLTLSLQAEFAGPVAIVASGAETVLAVIWQVWFFRDMPDGWSVSGCFAVALSIALISLGKRIKSSPRVENE